MSRWQEDAVANGENVRSKIIFICHAVSNMVIGDLQKH